MRIFISTCAQVRDILSHLNYDINGKKHLLFLSHFKRTGGDAARIFIDRAQHILQDETSFTGDLANAVAVRALPMQDRMFLDSANLVDLNGLLDHVAQSANLVLLLTKQTLERPWVLAEIATAFARGVNILVIRYYLFHTLIAHSTPQHVCRASMAMQLASRVGDGALHDELSSSFCLHRRIS